MQRSTVPKSGTIVSRNSLHGAVLQYHEHPLRAQTVHGSYSLDVTYPCIISRYFSSREKVKLTNVFTAGPDDTMPQKLKQLAPHFTGPITPAESVELCMNVINRASVQDEQFAGQFVSQFGNKTWL